MNLKEAYTILELSPGVTPEEAKKKYRELTKKWHPDVNKDPGAEDKFKKINEAYQIVQSGKGTDIPERQQPFSRSPFHRYQVIELENIDLGLVISFKESVLGCKKEVKYSRKTKCQTCEGKGEVALNNGCKKCQGKGKTVSRNGGSVFITTCTECYGRSQTEPCIQCVGDGVLEADVSIHVSVPAGITDGTTLRLQGMGNYVGSFMGFADQHTDAYCHITVTPEPGLTLEGKNVISHVSLPLLDALKGRKCLVKTIYGDKEITISPKSRNADAVIIPNCGVSGLGDQRVILDVQYPQDIDKLINALSNEES